MTRCSLQQSNCLAKAKGMLRGWVPRHVHGAVTEVAPRVDFHVPLLIASR
jgi:hypothetical protein